MIKSDTVYTVFIVEDMEFEQRQFMRYVSERKELQFSGSADNGKEALEKLQENSCDLLLLDINLPGMSGMEIIEKIINRPYIIFMTAHDEYLKKAFDIGAVDYLLKPVTRERFNTAIDRFIERKMGSQALLKPTKDKCLIFKERKKVCNVAFKEIIYLSSAGKKSVIHTEKNDFEVASVLKKMEEKLPEDLFKRIHKQFIVNLEYIVRLEYDAGWQYQAILKNEDETRLPVGKDYVLPLKEALEMSIQ